VPFEDAGQTADAPARDQAADGTTGPDDRGAGADDRGAGADGA
jgi:hypothetical protein